MKSPPPFLLMIKHARSVGGPAGYYSNDWILKFSGGRDGVHSFAGTNGFEVVSETNGYYVLRKTDLPPVSEYSDTTGIRSMDTKVEKLEQLRYLNRTTRSVVPRTLNISDAAWSTMWHVHKDKFPSMGVYDAWLLGYTGAGLHVSVLDNGVEPDHPDLVENYDEVNSYDFLLDMNYVNHSTVNEYHGTWCAGIVSAVKNNACAIGMAYNSKFSAVKIFDDEFFLNDLGESFALTHALDHTDIYSNSWGPYDSGEIFEAPLWLTQAALKTGVTEGRGGLGAIYTWAAGNGGIYDDCNCDGYAGSIYTISVTSIGYDQAPSWYSEECTSIMVGTYSGDSPDPTITTTHIGGGCTTFFQGTSASCPMGAGIIALALEANPTLTWRDVQHLIVETSLKEGLIGGEWTTNGAGFRVSHAYGFGMMNAAGMVNAALGWTNVPQQLTCEREMAAINSASDNGVSIVSEHVSSGCDGGVQYLEHVEVWMSFSATYRGAIVIKLTSPSGTRSRLLRAREFDRYNGTTEWTFMTVHSWGERSEGTWTLEVETTDSSTVFGLDSWKLILYGTQSPPANNPAAQVSVEEEDDDSTTWAIVGGVLGGVVLFAVVAVLTYTFVLKKQKDPTVYPTSTEGDPTVYPTSTEGDPTVYPTSTEGADNAGYQQET